MRSRRIWAGLVSLVVPGAGHFAIGRPWRGVAWWAVAVISLLLLPVVVWMPTAFTMLLVRVVSAVEVFVLRDVRAVPWKRVWAMWGIALVVSFGVTRVIRAFYIEAFKIPSGAMIPTLQIGDHIFINKLADWGPGDVVVFVNPCEPDKDFVKRVVAEGGDTVEVRCGSLYVNGEAVEQKYVDTCEYWDRMDMPDSWRQERYACYHETLGGTTYTTIYGEMRPDLLERARSQPAAAFSGGLRDRDFPGSRAPTCGGRGTEQPEGTLEPSTPENQTYDGPCAPTRRYVVPDGHVFVMGDNRENSSDSRQWGPVPDDNIKGKAFLIWWSSRPAAQGGVDWGRIDSPL